MNLPQDTWIIPTQLFDGYTLSNDSAIHMVDGVVRAIAPINDIPQDGLITQLTGILSPGFFDIQINGGGNVLFNSSPNCEGLSRIATAHRAGGTTHWLPTVITDAPEVLEAACDAILECIGKFGIAGIHIEGPHLAIERKGTHKSHWIRPFDAHTYNQIERLRARDIPVLITLAPETMQPGQVASLVALGAVVSIGHTNATAAQTKQTLAEGAQLFTHLFNAMSQIENRALNVVGTAINSDQYCSIIVDGLHVDLGLVGLATRARPVADRMIIVSDAMPTVGGDAEFMLYGNTVKLHEGRLVNNEGSLAGAHITMLEELHNMVHKVGVPLQDALRMTTSNPATLMGFKDIGRITPNMRADLLLLDPDLKFLSVLEV